MKSMAERYLDITYRGDEIYSINNSTKELTYRADKIYPTLMDDKTIRPVSSNMRLVRRNDTYKSIDSLANIYRSKISHFQGR
jgi:hypothetical protein